jgi:hypothetical protein
MPCTKQFKLTLHKAAVLTSNALVIPAIACKSQCLFFGYALSNATTAVPPYSEDYSYPLFKYSTINPK